MNTDSKPSGTSPTATAVTCGRVVFFFVGFVMMAIPLLLAYAGLEIDDPVEWLCIVAGIALVLLGATLPPKIVAHAGFDLPFFLPDGD